MRIMANPHSCREAIPSREDNTDRRGEEKKMREEVRGPASRNGA